MKALVNAWANFVLARRAIIIGITVLLLPVILLTGGTIPFDNSTERYFIAGDPTLLEYDRLLELFGDNEYLIVGIEASTGQADIFNAQALDALVRLSDFLDFHPNVTQLRSLANYQYIHADGDNLSTDYLIDDVSEIANDPSAIERIKTTLLDEELAMDTLVSRDFRHIRIAARVEYRAETSEHKVALTQDLYRFVEEENLQSAAYTLHLSGYPLVNERFETLSAEDTSFLVPIMSVIMLVILFLSFRSVVATLFPWLVIGPSLLLLLEIQYYIGIPHTTIDNSALLSTLIIIGIGITVHVLLEFFHFTNSEINSVEAARETILHIWVPAFFTAITTSAGFLALSVIRIMPIREFALLGAMGSILLFLFSLTVLPAMLSYVTRVPAKTFTVLNSGLVSRLTRRVPDFTLKFRNHILFLGIATIAFVAWFLPNARVDNNYVTLFKENSEIRQDIVYFDEVFKGMMTLDIILDAGESDGIKDPIFLAKLEELQSWLAGREKLGKINSLVDYLKEINQALNSDDPAYYRLPDSKEMSAQFLLLYDSSGANEDLSDIKDFDQRYARLVVPVTNMPASEMQVELDAITAYLQSEHQELQPLLTGTMVLYTVQDIYTAQGMVLSFLVALVVITLFFCILFRSIRYGLLSIIPSVMPILLAASIAGFLGIYLDQSAVIVFAMTMGIAVDDAIHVMSRYLLAKQQGSTTKHAIQRAMNESGRAVVFSSMVLVFGFSVLTFASFTAVIYVGLFGSIIMSLALLGDLIFLPAILYLVDKSTMPEDSSAAIEA